jgi:leucyl-tRNA synthetase
MGKLGHADSVFTAGWPAWDPEALVRDSVEIVVQVNGSIRYRLDIPSGAERAAVEDLVMAEPRTTPLLEGKKLLKFIYVPNRLVNLVRSLTAWTKVPCTWPRSPQALPPV